VNRVWIVLCCAVMLSSSVVFANDAADELDRQAKVLYGRGEYQGAYDAFMAAYEASSEARYLYNAAKTLERLGRTSEAYKTYDRYMRESSGAEERAAAARILVQLCPELDGVTLRVSSVPAGAQVSVDGQAFPVPSEVDVCLASGSHDLILSKAGYLDALRVVDFTAGSHEALRVELKRAAGTGKIAVTSGGVGARVRLDGREVGEAPLELDVSSGQEHLIEVDAGEGYTPWRRTVMVHAGRSLSLDARLTSRAAEPAAELSPDGHLNWGWVTIGAGATAVILGGALYGLAYKDYVAANDLNPDLPDYDAQFDDLVASGETYKIGAYVGIGVGVVFGVVTPLVWDSGDEPGDVAFIPWTDGQGLGLGARWRF
jgi:tetratricopeptide (TPR) repeat protein